MKSYEIDGTRFGQARQILKDEDGKPLTQSATADKLGVHAVTLNRIENGKARVSLDLLERMSELTGKSREWLLGEDEPVDPFEENRAKLTEAVNQLAAGFGLLNDLMEQVGLAITPPVEPKKRKAVA
jgi:transcriptional regulator with XRE-family HTH domain